MRPDPRRRRCWPLAGVALAALTALGGCAAAPPGIPASGSTTVTPGGTSSSSDDAPTSLPSGTGPRGAAGCPARPPSAGPAGSAVVVAISAPATAAAGSTVPVSSRLVVLSDGPRIVLRPQSSALEVLRGGAVVARTVGTTGPDVPMPLSAGASFPGQPLPPQVALVGCDGSALAPGTYQLRAAVGYGSDPLNGAPGGGSAGSGSFVLVSDPPLDLTIT